MRTATPGLAIASALLLTAPVLAQPPATAPAAQLSTTTDPPQPTTSNRWESLPAMSPHRCTAELLGTATDPKTGAPVSAAIDPKTGKPICPTVTPTAKTKAKSSR